MADWKQITARIRRARGSKDPAGQLTLLYEKTGDAMDEKPTRPAGHYGWKLARREIMIHGFRVLIGYFVLIFYWRGRDWPRNLVLLISVLGLLNLRFLPQHTIPSPAVLIKEAVLGGCHTDVCP